MNSQDKCHADAGPSARDDLLSRGHVLRQRAEATLREAAAQPPKTTGTWFPEAIQQTLHDLSVHQIELEMQNDELRRAQVALDASQARYADLYDCAPVGYCTVSKSGLILEANLTAATLLGVGRRKLVKQLISRFILDADQDIFYLLRKQLIATGEPSACKLRMVKHDGTPFRAHLMVNAVQNEDGAPVVRVVLTDVTHLCQAEEAMREWQTFVECATWGMSIISFSSLEGRTVQLANPAYARMHGYTVEELRNIDPDVLYAPESRASLPHFVKRKDGDFSFECVRLRKDGSTFPAIVEIYIADGVDGHATTMVNVRDITEPRRGEAKVLAMQSQLQATLDAIPDLLFELGPDGRYYDYHSPHTDLLIVPAAEFIGKKVSDVLPPAAADVIMQALHEADEKGRSNGKQIELPLPQGDLWFELSVSRKHTEPGLEPRFIVMSRNITGRKQAEAALRVSEARYHSVVSALSEGIVSNARDGAVLAWNHAAERILGLSGDQIQGRAAYDPHWRAIHEDGTPFPDEAHPSLKVLRTGVPESNIIMGVHKPCGTLTWISINAVPVFDHGNPRPSAVVVSFSDVTERKKLKLERINHLKRLKDMSRRLVAAQENTRRQLSGELHDRTSPNLAAISINLDIIATEFQHNYSTEITERLEDIRALIMDTTASIREICANMRPPLLDYAGLVAALESYVQQFARRTGIAVQFDCINRDARYAPELESLLFRIFQEALTNCAKHARATSASVMLSNGDHPIALTITDDGVGFDPAQLREDGHIGLGLLNMREMAEIANGKFTVESAPGKGTRITVEIS